MSTPNRVARPNLCCQVTGYPLNKKTSLCSSRECRISNYIAALEAQAERLCEAVDALEVINTCAACGAALDHASYLRAAYCSDSDCETDDDDEEEIDIDGLKARLVEQAAKLRKLIGKE